MGLLYSHDPWAGRGPLVGGLAACCGTRFRAPPHIAVAIHPLRPSTAGHPDGWRTAHSANTYYRDLDTVRWSKWNVDRVLSLGDGVPETWYGLGCTVCTVRTQCAQSVHKVCTKDKCAHCVTRVHNKNDSTSSVREMYQNLDAVSSSTFN